MVIPWRHEHQNARARLARWTAATRLGAETTRVETDRHCRRPGRHARSRQPVAQTRPGLRAWRRCGAIRPPDRRPARQPSNGPGFLGCCSRRPGVGVVGEVWTCKRVADVIRRTFGVSYHPAHIYKLLIRLSTATSGPSTGPPSATRRPSPPGGASAGLPSKKAAEEGRTIIWVDQSGFYLLPMAVRTWAPRRHTPILRVPLTHDHLSAIGGLTPDGRLFLQSQTRATTARMSCASCGWCCARFPASCS